MAKTKQSQPRLRRRRRVSNPSGISGIVQGGLYIYAGIYLGGLINGFIPSFGGGMLMEAARGLASSYIVQMIASRFTSNAGMMAAGAFAGSAGSLVSSVLGGAGNLLGSGGSSKGTVEQPHVQ